MRGSTAGKALPTGASVRCVRCSLNTPPTMCAIFCQCARRFWRAAGSWTAPTGCAGECDGLVKNVMREDERWRISGSARLSRRQLAVLQRSVALARPAGPSLNVPAARVLGDSMLIEIARRSPATVEDLFSIRGLDSRLLRKAEQDVVDAVAGRAPSRSPSCPATSGATTRRRLRC